jgi:exosortase O
MVRDGLRVFGVTSIGVDTILVFENGISTVDVPCSGVKSLWSGVLFLLAATWIERRRLNLIWLAIAGVFVALLFLGNLTRVGILVVVGEALGHRDLAAMLHVPLGVGVFALTCLAPYGLLRWRAPLLSSDRPPSPAPTPRWRAPALAAAIVAISAVHSPRTTVGGFGVAPALRLPATMTLREQPLTERESEWLTRDGADWFQRFRFTSSMGDGQSVAGSVILVQASTWRAHHRPERCFEVLGIKLGDSRTDLIASDFPIRVFRVGDAPAETYAAAYWYQSPSATTDDFGARVWSDLTGNSQSWMLVSLVLENQADPASPPARAFIRALRDAVAQSQSAPGPAQPTSGGIHGSNP